MATKALRSKQRFQVACHQSIPSLPCCEAWNRWAPACANFTHTQGFGKGKAHPPYFTSTVLEFIRGKALATAGSQHQHNLCDITWLMISVPKITDFNMLLKLHFSSCQENFSLKYSCLLHMKLLESVYRRSPRFQRESLTPWALYTYI